VSLTPTWTIPKKATVPCLLEDQGVDISRAGAALALDLDAHPEVATPFIEGLRAAGALAKVGLDPSVFSVEIDVTWKAIY
jgi:hypothetical protein